MRRRLGVCVVSAVLLLAGCNGSENEPEQAVCKLGLVDPLPATLADEARRAEPFLPEVTDPDIARFGREVIDLIPAAQDPDPRLGSVPFMALLNALTDLNNACTAAGVD